MTPEMRNNRLACCPIFVWFRAGIVSEEKIRVIRAVLVDTPSGSSEAVSSLVEADRLFRLIRLEKPRVALGLKPPKLADILALHRCCCAGPAHPEAF